MNRLMCPHLMTWRGCGVLSGRGEPRDPSSLGSLGIL
jgi:hypothetical protein